jgi:hypothetical protein
VVLRHEGPEDIHAVRRNASNSKPAKFLVLLIKEKGVPPAAGEIDKVYRLGLSGHGFATQAASFRVAA